MGWGKKGANSRPEESKKSGPFLLRTREGFHVMSDRGYRSDTLLLFCFMIEVKGADQQPRTGEGECRARQEPMPGH